MKRIIIFSLMLALCGISLSAQRPQRVPAFRGVIEKIQPNGDTLHIFLRGDEHYHYSMTLDGWQVMENKKGVICYAKLKKGEAVASGKRAKDADKRSRCEQRWLQKKGIMKMKKGEEE